ncbi:MAG: hypothetical protein ACOCQR_03385 [bacterium]
MVLDNFTDATNQGDQGIYIVGNGEVNTPNGSSVKVEKKKGMKPSLYFKFIKKKFGILGGKSMQRRIDKIQKLAEEAIDNGQEALSEKFLERLSKEVRESEMYAKGFKVFIENKYISEFKGKVNGVELTKLKNYTGIIPKDVMKKKKKAENLFDEFYVMHTDKEKEELTEEEKKDPILFGQIKESDRYYFIDDWEDEYCDLTLDDIIDQLNLTQDEVDNMKLTKNPENIKGECVDDMC